MIRINIIIGKNSNLSNHLAKHIDNSYRVSSKNIESELDDIDLSNKKINIIFNNFQVSTKLNDLSNPTEYVNRSIMTTAKVLNYILDNNLEVNKIIYTSSSSVYGNNELCNERDPLQPLTIHSSLKIANERLIESFSIKNGIDYTITRIFNMYGGDDNFSIISKIVEAYRKNSILNIFNGGSATRDFIHIDDVIKIYRVLLDKNLNIPILNIGRGVEQSVGELISFLESRGIYINTRNRLRDELKKSTADISKLLNIMGEDMEFIKLQDYLLKEILKI